MTTITSPVEGFTGKTSFGPLEVEFEDGKADVEDLPDGIRDYLLGAGYKVGRKQGQAVTTLDGNAVDEQPVDARDYDSPQVVGTELRDAAVDPEPDDFLAPTNAGEADPHGPDVVSPEIHASQGVRPVKGGDVHVDDTDAQDEAETKHAEAATDGTPVDGLTVPEGDLDARIAWVGEGEHEVERTQRANAVFAHEQEAGDSDLEALAERLRKAVYPQPDGGTADDGTRTLKGEALDEALTEAGLSKSGTADEKRQRLAEHQAQG